MYKLILKSAFFLGLVFSISTAFSAPNDNFSNATVLTGTTLSFSDSIDFVGAEPGEPGVSGETVWYRWTAPVTGHAAYWMAANSCCTTLRVYTGNNVSNLTQVDSGFFSSTDHFPISAGVTYYFQLGDASNKTIYFFLNAAQPAHDDFNNRLVVSGLSGVVNNLTLLNATFESTEQYHGPTNYPSGSRVHDGSIWLTWTAPQTGLLDFTINELYDSAPSAHLFLYEGSSMTGMVLGDEVFGVTAGTTYQIQLTSISRARILNQTGLPQNQQPDWGPQFNLQWNMVAGGPVNDYFSQATVISGASGTLTNQTLTKATNEIGEATSSYSSVWYEWTAGFTGRVRFNAQGIDTSSEYANPVHMTLYTGTAVNDLTEISTNTRNNYVVGNVEEGVTYKLRIGSVNDCSKRADGDYCTTQASSTTPLGGIDDFGVNWLRVYGNDLRVDVTAPRGNLLSENITYEITVITSNNTENVTVTSTLPAGLSVVSLPSQCSVTGQVVTCFYSDLTNSNDTMSWVLSASSEDTYELSVDVSQSDPESNTNNNSISGTTLVATEIVDLSLMVSAPQSVAADSVSQFNVTLSVENLGPSVANNVAINYEVGDGLDVNASLLPGNCSLAGTTVTCILSSLVSGASQSILITLSIPQPVQLGRKFHVTSVTSNTAEAILENNEENLRSTHVNGPCEVVTCLEQQTHPVPLPLWANLLLLGMVSGVGVYAKRRNKRM